MSEVEGGGDSAASQTLHGAALEAHQRRLERERVVETAPSAAPAEVSATPSVDPYESWVSTAPEEYRNKFTATVQNQHAQALANYYGPEITEILSEASKDPELKKRLAKLTDKGRRKFLLEQADAIYEAQREPESAPDAALAKVEQLERKITEREQTDVNERYIAQRTKERDALLAKFPELHWTDPTSPAARRLTAVIEQAEIDTRREGKPISYAEKYEQMKSMWDNQAANPPRAPIRSVSGNAPPNRQAPRNKVEARTAINAELQRYGGLSGLAAALRK